MAYNRSGTRRTSSSRQYRRSSYIVRPMPLISQPVNRRQSYNNGQTNAPDQPLTFPVNGSSIEGSQNGFRSDLSTHPSTYYANYASGLSSGSTSELGSARGLSFGTPSASTSSNNGDIPDLFGEASPCEHRSPHDPDGALQGIDSSNHDPEIYSYQSRFDSLPYYNRDTKVLDFPEAQPDYSSRISTQIPPRLNPPQEPWSQLVPHYNGPSYPCDVVDEGSIFEQFLSYNCWPPQPTQGIAQRYRQQEQFRDTSYSGFTDTPQHSVSPDAGQGHKYQENGNTDGDTPVSSSSESAGSPANSTTVAPRKTGGRTGPLSESGRQNASFMRKKGSCYRCFAMREKCTLDEESSRDGICQRCRKIFNNLRSWDIPCSEIGLDKRIKFLIPGFLVDQLSGCRVNTFLKEHVRGILQGSVIKLPLTAGFGNPLILDAVQVVPRDRERVRMRGVSPANGGSASIVELNSPPILPYLTDRHKIERHFNQWLDSTIGEAGSDLPEHCFPGTHEYWENRILSIICEYYRTTALKLEAFASTPHDTLRRALKLTVLNHMICHPFVVPDEEVESLYGQLKGKHDLDDDQSVCPRFANKVIKSLLFPMLNRMAREVLSGLHRLLRKRGQEDSLWDPLFCIIFLCLIVVGKFQVSYLERAELGLANNDNSVSRENAASGIEEMEGELSVHLIGQFHACFGTNRKGNGNGKSYNPLSRDRTTGSTFLAEHVSFATKAYGQHIFNQKDVPRGDVGAMKERNLQQLLARFMKPFVAAA